MTSDLTREQWRSFFNALSRKKERNMTNVETFTNNTDVALEALNALNAAEANLADAVYNDDNTEFETRVLAPTEVDGEVEVFEQADPADAVILN